MKQLILRLLPLLAVMGCQRATIIQGEWVGKDTVLYLSRYEERCFTIVDSIPVHDGAFTWEGKMRTDMLYGLSDNKRSRHPATFFPEEGSFRMKLWANGEIVTQRSANNTLLQHTLATQFRADTLISRHPESPVSAYIATRILVNTLPYDSLLTLRKRITLRKHPYTEELDATLQAIRRVHPGAFAPPIEGIEFRDTTLLVFHATWCPDCLASWPPINTFLEEHPDVHLAAIDIDSIGWNGEAAKAYAVRGVPTIFLITKGKILRTSL